MNIKEDLACLVSLWRLLRPIARKSWLVALFLWVLIIGPAQAATELRIAIKKNISQIKVGSSTPALVKDGAGRTLGEIQEMDAISAVPSGSGVSVSQWRSSQILIEPKDDGFIWIGDRWYRGRVRLMRTGGGVTAINQVGLEQYLYSVVGAEAIPSWSLEALKAQAVAARTYALYTTSTTGNRFYDLDTTTKTQVYKGLETEFLSTHEAVEETKGQVMTYNGQVILAAFHSSSGGHTENVEDVWSYPLPYLRGVVDYDQLAPVFQWTKTYSSGQLSSLIGGVGMIKSMIPEQTTPQGRVVTMKVLGTGGSKRISGSQLRKVLDLRSTLFVVSADNGKFDINGRGFGHGLGLSQWGSQYLAEQGVSYDRILTHYYQNAVLTQMEK
ncbi:SpoIID/LytB domain-containing protein [Gloeothece verrucosa]|uniref:SpoIID/LytB domain protein n=1 Tax=Gloeothece verrucosa (strain PCC 7822) TaxID=497965 RepID=E0UBM9_GLOV7|nr:SpoIID/LytB domain-containing protein [Gloeothece verrucosa]ADN13973.1 SpoIID/LytB domain protein [Gloeothece verrucosa PCC 7822]